MSLNEREHQQVAAMTPSPTQGTVMAVDQTILDGIAYLSNDALLAVLQSANDIVKNLDNDLYHASSIEQDHQRRRADLKQSIRQLQQALMNHYAHRCLNSSEASMRRLFTSLQQGPKTGNIIPYPASRTNDEPMQPVIHTWLAVVEKGHWTLYLDGAPALTTDIYDALTQHVGKAIAEHDLYIEIAASQLQRGEQIRSQAAELQQKG